MAPIDDFLSWFWCRTNLSLVAVSWDCWNDDENKRSFMLTRRRALDNFDFQFNPKMNRSLVFDLATATLSSRGMKTFCS